MEIRQLGNSGVSVSGVIFGAWAIGGWMWGGTEEKQSIEAINAGLDAGMTTIDTAAIYGYGYSEELVGKAIRGRRDRPIIATKCGMRWDSDEGTDPWPQPQNDAQGKQIVIRKNSRPASIAFECEQSLKRLGVDTIDIFQIHWPDVSTPVADSIGALDRLRTAGKIRAIGLSNYDLPRLREAVAVARIDCIQPSYSVVRRKIENDLLPYCRQNNIGVICYSPMERGLLTGSAGPDRQFPPGDHRRNSPTFSLENRQRVHDALQKIKPIADKLGASFAQLAVNWAAHQPGITAAIVGARDAEQARHNAAALNFKLSADDRATIRSAFDNAAQFFATSEFGGSRAATMPPAAQPAART